MLKLRYVFAALSIGIFTAPSQAASKLPYKPTDVEISTLPDYCKVRLKGDASANRSLAERMGKDKVLHLHHFCVGLNYMNRAMSSFDKRQRGVYLQQAISEFDYVLRNWPADFNLAGEAKSKKLMAESMLKRH